MLHDRHACVTGWSVSGRGITARRDTRPEARCRRRDARDTRPTRRSRVRTVACAHNWPRSSSVHKAGDTSPATSPRFLARRNSSEKSSSWTRPISSSTADTNPGAAQDAVAMLRMAASLCAGHRRVADVPAQGGQQVAAQRPGVHRSLSVAEEFSAQDVEHQLVTTRPAAVDGGLGRLCPGGHRIDGQPIEAAVDQQLHHRRADRRLAREPTADRRLGRFGHHRPRHRPPPHHVYETVQYTSRGVARQANACRQAHRPSRAEVRRAGACPTTRGTLRTAAAGVSAARIATVRDPRPGTAASRRPHRGSAAPRTGAAPAPPGSASRARNAR